METMNDKLAYMAMLIRFDHVDHVERLAYLCEMTVETATACVMTLIENGTINCDDVVAPE